MDLDQRKVDRRLLQLLVQLSALGLVLAKKNRRTEKMSPLFLNKMIGQSFCLLIRISEHPLVFLPYVVVQS